MKNFGPINHAIAFGVGAVALVGVGGLALFHKNRPQHPLAMSDVSVLAVPSTEVSGEPALPPVQQPEVAGAKGDDSAECPAKDRIDFDPATWPKRLLNKHFFV